MYCNPQKIGPPSENKPIPQKVVVAKGAFLSKIWPPIYAAVHVIMLSTKAVLCKRRHAHDKINTAKSLINCGRS